MQNRFAHLIPGQQQADPYQAPPIRQIVPPQPKQPAARHPEEVQGDVLDNRKTEIDIAEKERDLAKGRTPGLDAIDTEFAKDYVAYTAGGGFADVRKQLSQLRETTDLLKSGQNITGPGIGRVPDAVTSWTNPQVISARENVEEVAQRALRQILGAQFTEKEGERLIARAYNPKLPEIENRKRVARLRIQLTRAAMAKEDAVKYFDKHGTLKGWKGKMPSMSDFNPEADDPPQAAAGRTQQRGLPRGVTVEPLD